jgi:hypothetical protein
MRKRFLGGLIAVGGAGLVLGFAVCARTNDPGAPAWDPAAAAPASRLALQGGLRFAVIGDYGVADSDEAAVATLVKSWNPDLVITTGDNNYPDGAAASIDANIGQYYASFISPYLGIYGPGATSNNFFPSLGNHDWVAPNAQPYLDYFVLPGNERYYDFVRGPVHFFVVDSDPNEPDGVTSTSAQAVWLKAALAASRERWKIVYFHHSPFSSGSHGPTVYMQWPFHEWGADVVLSGHDHDYERFDKGGTPYIVGGVGGNERYPFGAVTADSQVRYNATPGAELVLADAATLTLAFYAAGGALIDTLTLPSSNVTGTGTGGSAGTRTGGSAGAGTGGSAGTTTGTGVLRGQASNDALTTTYTLAGSSSFTWRRVYIDTDNSTTSGFLAGGVGADFMIENAWLYSHGAAGWTWHLVGSAGMTTVGDDVSWTIARAAIGQTAFPDTNTLSFEVATSAGAVQNLGRYVQVYAGSAPAAQPISAVSADNDSTTIHYRATFAPAYAFKHVFIDTDTNPGTGYPFAGVGADYLIENGAVYQHAGAGWKWNWVGSAIVTGGSTGPLQWTVSRALLGETAPTGERADLILHGSGGATEYATPIYHHVYSASGN